MIKKFNRAIDKLPLSGKFIIGPSMERYIKADYEHARSQYLKTSLLLGIFVLAHGYQAKLGINALENHTQHIDATGDPVDGAWMALDGTYAVVNAAVTLRQMALLQKLHNIRRRKIRRWNNSVTALVNTAHESVETSDSEAGYIRNRMGAIGLAAAVTLGGQAAFITSSAIGHIEKIQMDCAKNAEDNSVAAGSYLTAAGERIMRSDISEQCGVSPSMIHFPEYSRQIALNTTTAGD